MGGPKRMTGGLKESPLKKTLRRMQEEMDKIRQEVEVLRDRVKVLENRDLLED